MKNTSFKAIENRLNQLLEEQNNLISRVKGNPDINKWTIEQLKNNVKKARNIQKVQDMFLTADLYHILGMGNLTISQTSKLLKQVRSITSDRCFIKQLAGISANSDFKFSAEDFSTTGKGKYTSTLFGLKLEEELK